MSTLKIGPMLTANKTFTKEQWKVMVAADPVMSFVERVNKVAVAKDYWEVDYRRALFDAFHEEMGKHALKTFNDGEPFNIQ